MKKSRREKEGRGRGRRPRAGVVSAVAETLVLLPVGPESVHVYWQLADPAAPGGGELWLRFYESGGEAVALARKAEGVSGKCYLSLPPGREYRAEAGWLDGQGQFLRVVASNRIQTMAPEPEAAELVSAPVMPLPAPLSPAAPRPDFSSRMTPPEQDRFWAAVIAELGEKFAASSRPEFLAGAAAAGPLSPGPEAETFLFRLARDYASSPAIYRDLTALCEARFRGGSSSSRG